MRDSDVTTRVYMLATRVFDASDFRTVGPFDRDWGNLVSCLTDLSNLD